MLYLLLASVFAPCLIVGDDIAQRVAHFKPECAVVARPESSSATLQNFKPKGYYPRVYISVGTHGSQNPKLMQNLYKIRGRYKKSIVTWIVPRNSRASYMVKMTAVKFHDRVVSLDVIRPKGALREIDYARVAKQL